MNHNELIQMLNKFADEYCASEPSASVARNGHMNNHDGSIIPAETSDKVVRDFMSYVAVKGPDLSFVNRGFLVNALIGCAKDYTGQENGLTKEIEKDAFEALVVDYVNFVGTKQGLDVALCTEDLNKSDALK